MSKFIFRLLFSVLLVGASYFSFAQASDILGGHINYQCIGNGNYIVSLNVLQRCTGTPITANQTITLVSSCGANIAVTLPRVSGIEISNYCSSTESECNFGGTKVGVNRVIFRDTISLDPVCNFWTLSWNKCCRENTINLNLGGSPSIYLETRVNNFGVGLTCKEGIKYKEEALFTCSTDSTIFNLGAYQLNDDSLKYELVAAKLDALTNVTYSGAGISGTNPISGISINQFTGELKFKASFVGVYSVVIKITQFLPNGLIAGSEIIEFPVVVQNNTVCTAPNTTDGLIQNLVGGTLTNNRTIAMCDGNSISFDISISDINTTDSISLSSNISNVIKGAIITYSGKNPITAHITWTSLGGDPDFQTFVIKANDNSCPFSNQKTYTYQVIIKPATVVSQNKVICGNLQANLVVTGGSMFNWSVLSGEAITASNFSCNSCANPISTVTTTTTYQVASNLGSATCPNKDTVTVIVVNDFSYTKSNLIDTVCLFQDVPLEVLPNSLSYSWSSDFNYNNNIVNNPIALELPNGGNQYFVFDVTSANNCTKTDSIKVNVRNSFPPTFVISGNNVVTKPGANTICDSASSKLNVQFLPPPGTTCDYSINMCDFDNDTWSNGGTIVSIEFFINGVSVADFTKSSNNHCDPVTLSVVQGDSLTLFFHDDPSFQVENQIGYQIFDGTGALVFKDGDAETDALSSQPAFGWVFPQPHIVTCPSIVNPNHIYAWTPFVFINDTTLINPNITPSVDTTFIARVFDPITGCRDSSEFPVTVVPNFSYTISAVDTAICLNDSTDVGVIVGTDTTNFVFTWNPSSLFTPKIGDTVKFGGDTAGTYYLVLEMAAAFGCTTVDSIKVVVSKGSTPSINLTANPPQICEGNTANLNTNFTNDSCNVFLILNDFGNNGWEGAEIILTINNLLADTFTLTFLSDTTIPFVLHQNDSIIVEFIAGINTIQDSYYIVNQFGDTLLQSGANPTVGITLINNILCIPPSYTFNWQQTSSLNNLNIYNPIATPIATEIYQLIVLDTVGFCGDTSSITLVVDSMPNAAFDSSVVICLADDTTTLSPLFTGGTWSGLGITNSSLGLFTPSVAGIGSHTISYQLINGACIANNTANIVVRSNPLAPVASGDTIYCQGAVLSGFVSSGGGDSAAWYTNSTFISNQQNPSNAGLASNSQYYYTTIFVNGCESPADSLFVTANPTPIAAFSPSTFDGDVPFTVDFLNETNDIGIPVTWFWTFGNDSISTKLNPTTAYTLPGDFKVLLTASTTNGCTDTVSVSIHANEVLFLEIPNVFTPNGDNVNDHFGINTLGVSSLNIDIFNRWGKIIAVIPNKNATWDGDNYPGGTYYYIIKGKDLELTPFEKRGFFTLIR